MGACGLVDRVLDSRSEGLGVDSQCWPCVEVSGKLCIPHCLGPPSRNGYLVHRSKVGSIVAGCIGAHLARGKVKSVEHALSWSLDSKQLPSPDLYSPRVIARMYARVHVVNVATVCFKSLLQSNVSSSCSKFCQRQSLRNMSFCCWQLIVI